MKRALVSRVGGVIAAATIAVGPAAVAQTWTLSQTASVTDISGSACAVCPAQTSSQTSTRTYTLPGATVLLNTGVADLLNEADLTIYGCPAGPPAGQHCLDRSDASCSARVRSRGMNIKHRIDADAHPRTSCDASVTTTASGVGTVRWPGMVAGAAVPGTLTIRMNATGTLNATCGCTPGSAVSDLNVSLALTGLPRAGGMMPPAVTPASLNVSTGACGGTVAGPYVLTLTLGPGLQVGDRYSYTFSFQNVAMASCTGPGINHADGAFGDTFLVHSLAGSVPETFFDFDVPDDCRDGNVNSGVGEIADVLFVNGSAGDQDHNVSLAVGAPLTLSLAAAPAGPIPTAYVVYAWFSSASNPRNISVGGTVVGCAIDPTPFHPGELPQPFRCLRGSAVPPAACSGVVTLPSPASAPWSLSRPQGIGQPLTIQLQAVLRDAGASNASQTSVSNAIVLKTQ